MKYITRDQWVAALRSGQYTQGRGFLQDAKGHNCCLGVAICECGVDLSAKQGLPALNTSFFNGGFRGDIDDQEVADRAGALQRSLGITDNQMHALAHLNDARVSDYEYSPGLFTFEDIADIIERDAIPVGDATDSLVEDKRIAYERALVPA